MPIHKDTLNKIYDILVECGGAFETNRRDFIAAHTSDTPCTEYRFQGYFGFGGKFYSDPKSNQYRIGYHKGDVITHPELYASLCKAINKLLAAIY